MGWAGRPWRRRRWRWCWRSRISSETGSRLRRSSQPSRAEAGRLLEMRLRGRRSRRGRSQPQWYLGRAKSSVSRSRPRAASPIDSQSAQVIRVGFARPRRWKLERSGQVRHRLTGSAGPVGFVPASELSCPPSVASYIVQHSPQHHNHQNPSKTTRTKPSALFSRPGQQCPRAGLSPPPLS